MTKNYMYSIPCSCGNTYKPEPCCLLKVRLGNISMSEDVEKLITAGHIWKENGHHLPLFDEVKINDREEHSRVKCIKGAAHMLGYN